MEGQHLSFIIFMALLSVDAVVLSVFPALQH